MAPYEREAVVLQVVLLVLVLPRCLPGRDAHESLGAE